MNRRPSDSALPPAQRVAEKVFSALERFIHVEAVSGVVLLIAAAVALIWANSQAAASYQHLWHTPLVLGVGDFVVSQPVHFWINDGLMTIFFLVVGMEIRREIHEGALSTLQLAALPLIAALGGVLAPALIYLGFVEDPVLRAGWAVPIATDIAFAVGVLALLGRSIPSGVRIFLLALAIIDDIAAVLVIAVFYSAGLDYTGLLIAAAAVLLVLALQQIGVRSSWAYVAPGLLLWLGLLKTGVHPTLAGVVLGLMTPVRPLRRGTGPVDVASRALDEIEQRTQLEHVDPRELMAPIKALRQAHRELLPPVVRVQMTLHPWVAYGVMPLFALANAGVSVTGFGAAGSGAQTVMWAVAMGLLLGKPLGIVLASFAAVRLGVARLPGDVNWGGVLLIGLLGGIGFTMSIFIATLAFQSEAMLSAAKLGVLIASSTAAILGLLFGAVLSRRARAVSGTGLKPLGRGS